jgi:hypothetical protein
MKLRTVAAVVLLALAIIFLLDHFTNSLDIENFSWDFNYYIDLTNYGFDSPTLVSPFAYRYPTPFLARILSDGLSLSVETSYRIIAWTGAIFQLSGIFLIVSFVTRSMQGAILALLITALTIMNVKFLLFDVYRPDHLAYAFIILNFYFALTKRFYLLLIFTLIGVQFREFVLVPMAAYFLSVLFTDRKLFRKQLVPVLVCVFAAVILPRLLIPVKASQQFINPSAGLLKTIKIFFNPFRNLNYLFALTAYFLPLLIIFTRERYAKVKSLMSSDLKLLIVWYSILVAILAFIGGTGLIRFMTYFFIIQSVIIGFAFRFISVTEIVYMIAAVFIFNRIWKEIPMDSLENYLDFYSGYYARVNVNTFYRIIELAVLISGGTVVRKLAREKVVK